MTHMKARIYVAMKLTDFVFDAIAPSTSPSDELKIPTNPAKFVVVVWSFSVQKISYLCVHPSTTRSIKSIDNTINNEIPSHVALPAIWYMIDITFFIIRATYVK